MNADQWASLIRTVMKLAGGALVAHGMTAAGSLVNAEDIIGLVVSIVGVVWSHVHHKDA